MRNEKNYEKVLKNEDSLAFFMKIIHEFDEAFCRNMHRGKEFTLILEVRGTSCNLTHCRVKEDAIEHPPTKKKSK